MLLTGLVMAPCPTCLAVVASIAVMAISAPVTSLLSSCEARVR